MTAIPAGPTPNSEPDPHARKTPAKVATTCWPPRETVR